MTTHTVAPQTITLVEEFGFAKMNAFQVPGDETSRLKYTHTVNLPDKCGLPELIIFGLTKDKVNTLISGFIKAVDRGLLWEDEPLQVEGMLTGYLVELRPVHPSWLPEAMLEADAWRRHAGQGPLIEAIQMFWPDKDGHFPWDTETKDSFADQPRLDLMMPKHLQN